MNQKKKYFESAFLFLRRKPTKADRELSKRFCDITDVIKGGHNFPLIYEIACAALGRKVHNDDHYIEPRDAASFLLCAFIDCGKACEKTAEIVPLLLQRHSYRDQENGVLLLKKLIQQIPHHYDGKKAVASTLLLLESHFSSIICQVDEILPELVQKGIDVSEIIKVIDTKRYPP